MKPYLTIKRILDSVFALILLLIVSPIMVVSAIAIKLESRGSILFIQERLGKDTKVIKVYKFRTMKIETNYEDRQLSNKERLTKTGSFLRRTSIDELPQLFNILRGEMSFIGPRPLLVKYLEHYSPEQMRRHEVLPGISGWAQVNGRNKISWEQKFEHDVWYVDNVRFLLDLKIIWLTVYKVVRRKDINQNDDTTMEEFIGSKY
ncbi:sugar transferase [Proteiniborus sp.]|uniref:sugar transferase n=1 Tax=Proteiniborus sp. TaxID=2079015 RepID=UPI003327D74B